ncbi:phosphotransferase [Saccharopolyspora taberi]|uniref:phosphotransferase n=1 Tax=Saccharopolyspora taberi TaxID=60895 RepID=UPI0031CE41D5
MTDRRAAAARFLPDDPATLEVRSGQFHDVVIGAEHVVCFARTPAAAERLPRRAARLRAVSALRLGFATPEVLASGGSHLVLSRVPGRPLDAPAGPVVAAQYAELLSALAAADGAGLPSAPPDEWPTFADDVRAELFPLMSGPGRERAEAELAAVQALPPTTNAVVHGDLGSENVLWETVDGVPRLSGVIDWDEVAVGDQAVDLAAIAAGHGRALFDRLLESMGRPAGLDARIEAIRGTFALQQALSAVRDGDQAELDDGLVGYRGEANHHRAL